MGRDCRDRPTVQAPWASARHGPRAQRAACSHVSDAGQWPRLDQAGPGPIAEARLAVDVARARRCRPARAPVARHAARCARARCTGRRRWSPRRRRRAGAAHDRPPAEAGSAACRRARCRAAPPAARRARAPCAANAQPTRPPAGSPGCAPPARPAASLVEQHLFQPRHPVAALGPQPVALRHAAVAVQRAPSGFANARGRSRASPGSNSTRTRSVIGLALSLIQSRRHFEAP